jgi:tryptophan synthase alpha chain
VTVVTRLDDIFAAARAEGRGALMPFVTVGYPSLAVTREVLPVLADAGADAIELGIPFSDPIADGPVIAASMHDALVAGTTPDDAWDVVRDVRPACDAALIAMVSHSIVGRIGAAQFVSTAADAGIDGLIVPDVDLDTARELSRLAREHGIGFALLVSPTTRPERLARIVALCHGFVYVLARVGLTGERAGAPEIEARVAQLRAITDMPLAVGFGISDPGQVRAVTATADGAIVGSALVRRMGEADDPVEAARAFVSDLAGGLTRSAAG